MNDLISRSALMEQVKAIHKAVCTTEINVDYDTGFHSATSQIQGLIAWMPTAYDLDSVVAKIEAIKDAFVEGRQLYGYCIKHGDCADTNCFGCVLGNAIEIVKKGGVE